MRLSDLFLHQDVPDVDVTGLSSDSRFVKKGDVFFALRGMNHDGGEFISEAIKSGAVVIVSEVGEGLDLDVPVVQVDNARQSLANCCHQFFGKPSENFYLCGVTGTNGKTTVTYLLEALWVSKTSGVVGTVNTRWGEFVDTASHTTPDPIKLQQMFAKMSQGGVTEVAMEVSSHAVEQERVAGCAFDSAVFTNLTQDHLDYHKDMETYYQAKKRLFTTHLEKSPKASKVAIINCDCEYGKRLYSELKHGSFECFGFGHGEHGVDLSASRVCLNRSHTDVEFDFRGSSWGLKTNLVGRHNIQNIMAALLVAHHSSEGTHIEEMGTLLSHVQVPGRLEKVGDQAFVDYAHTPDALEKVLLALREVMEEGRLVVVFGCGGDRDRSKRPLMGVSAARLSDVCVVTSDNPRTENPESIIEDILPGIKKHLPPYKNRKGYVVEVEREQAIQKALSLLEQDDVLLVAGKGHEDYQVVGTQKKHFDDREVLRKYL